MTTIIGSEKKKILRLNKTDILACNLCKVNYYFIINKSPIQKKFKCINYIINI